MASSPPPPPPPPQQQEHEQKLYKTLHQALTNIGKSLTCPLCLSTYNDPVLLPCVHTYCRGCITQSLSHKPQCPTCAFKCTKRSIVDSPIFIDMVKSYKLVLKAMGWTPIVYSPSLLGMTQLLPDDNSQEGEEESTTPLPNPEECHLHYQVSKTWHRVLSSSNSSLFANEVLRQQQAAVVAVDQRALEAAKRMGKAERAPQTFMLVNDDKTLDAVKDDTTAGIHHLGGGSQSRLQGDDFLDAKSVDDDDATCLGENDEDENIAMNTVNHILEAPANGKSHDEDETTTMDETIQDITTVLTYQNLVLSTPSIAKANATDGTCPRDNKTRSDSKILLKEMILARQNSSRPESPMVENYSESMAFFTAESQTNTESQTMNSSSQEASNHAPPVGDGETAAQSPVSTQDASRHVRMESEAAARSVKCQTLEANAVSRNARKEHDDDDDDDDAVPPMASSKPAHSRSPISTQETSNESPNTRTESEAMACRESVAQSDSETGYQMDSEPVSHMEEVVDSARRVTSEPNMFSIGTIVRVQDRTWPGVNKPGGVARVTKIHSEGAIIAYDVAYVLGGREKKVEAVFVLEQEAEKKRRVAHDENEFSPELKALLSAEGFDTEGKVKLLDRMKRAEMKSEAKRKVLGSKKTDENVEPDVHPKKRQKGDTTRRAASKKWEEQGSPPRPALSDEQKCALANAHYEERFRVAGGEWVISVVTSSLSEGDLELLRLLCKETKRLDVQVKSTETFHADKTTLLIMPVDSQRNQDYPTSRTRTLKAMRAMLAGVPIVSVAWISACLGRGKAVVPSPDMYIRTVPAKTSGPNINDSLGASLCAARIQQASTLPHYKVELPLSNAFVLLCGQYNTAQGSPRKTDVQVLLRESGATLLPSAGAAIKKLKAIGVNDSSSKVVLLCDECPTNECCGISDGLFKEVMEALERDHQRVVVVSSAWLFDSISCGGMISSQPFEPCNPRGKRLWDAGNRPTVD